MRKAIAASLGAALIAAGVVPAFSRSREAGEPRKRLLASCISSVDRGTESLPQKVGHRQFSD